MKKLKIYGREYIFNHSFTKGTCDNCGASSEWREADYKFYRYMKFYKNKEGGWSWDGYDLCQDCRSYWYQITHAE